jgi:segregation and condensation protein B
VNEDDQPASLADQAAAWIPPWQRVTARPAEAPADPEPADEEDDEDEFQRPETDMVEDADPSPPDPSDVEKVAESTSSGLSDVTEVADSASPRLRDFTEVAALEGSERDNDTEVAVSEVLGRDDFTEVAVSEGSERDDFTEVAESTGLATDDIELAAPDVQDPDDYTEVAGMDFSGPRNFTEVAVSEAPVRGDFTEVAVSEVPERDDFTEVAALEAPEAAAEPESESGRPDNLAGALEAILLVVDEPVSADVLSEVLCVPLDETEAALAALARDYADQNRGFDLRRAAGGWRFYTRSEYASYVERFVLDGQSVRLTQAALETLAVIAYSQPVTRSRMSAIRGVNCDGVVRTLANRGLIEECGTQPDSGAFLYRTTDLFLEKLGLDSLVELPPLAPFLPDDVNGFADA